MSGRAQRIAIALCAFTASELLFGAVALASGFDPLSPATWSRWDSVHYLEIASGGYTLERCGQGDPRLAGAWCGSAGWFPGFPALIALLRAVGLHPGVAALALVAGCQLGVLYLLCTMLRDQRQESVGALALACVFPGSVYLHALFPLAPLLLCTLGAFHFASSGRWAAAAALSFIAATLYPSGFLAGCAIAAASQDRKGLSTAAAALLGLAAVAAAQHHSTGAWDAYLRVHAHFEQGLHNPLETLGVQLKPLVNPRHPAAGALWKAVQTVLVIGLLGWMLARAKELWRDDGLTRTVLLYTALAWLFPLVAGGQTPLYRTEALLLPAALLLPRLPLRALLPATAASLIVLVAMERLFLLSVLV